jgi:hypothetical protein
MYGIHHYDKPPFEDVYFVGGTMGKVVTTPDPGYIVERKIPHGVIPSSARIFFSPVNNLVSTHEFPELKTVSQLRAAASLRMDLVTTKEAILDGAHFSPSKFYRVRSEQFSVAYHETEDLYGVGPAPDNAPVTAVADGFWLFLKPLPSNATHTLWLKAEIYFPSPEPRSSKFWINSTRTTWSN